LSKPVDEVLTCTENDTAGESFELNISAAQRMVMLTGTVRAIILAQGSVPEK
jgi:hypothetical protein